MSYTIDNPKLVVSFYNPKEYNFTGVVKDNGGDIAYYKNGKIHREDGPAVERYHGIKDWYYNGKYYGENDEFTTESWTKKWKLEIFK